MYRNKDSSADLPSRAKLWASVLLFACCLGPLQAEGPTEDQLKAALIFKLVKFVSWPADKVSGAKGNFILCTLGRAPLDGQLGALQGKTSKGRELRLIETSLQGAGSENCDVLFLPKAYWDEDSVLNRVGVLTIGDREGFAERGGMIELGQRRKRVQLRINLAQAKEHGLHIDAQLLDLAKVVMEDRE